MVAADHGDDSLRYESHRRSTNPGSEPGVEADAAGVRHEVVAAVRCGIAAGVGVCEYAGLHHDFVLVVGFYTLDRTEQGPEFDGYRAAESWDGAGRPFIGVVSDRYGRVEVEGLLTFLCEVSMFAIWLPATSFRITTVFAISNSAILGVFWVVRNTAVT